MNAVEFTNVVGRAEESASPFIAELDGVRQPARASRREARLRYALLAGTALLAAWLAFAIDNSIKQLNVELDAARASIADARGVSPNY